MRKGDGLKDDPGPAAKHAQNRRDASLTTNPPPTPHTAPRLQTAPSPKHAAAQSKKSLSLTATEHSSRAFSQRPLLRRQFYRVCPVTSPHLRRSNPTRAPACDHAQNEQYVRCRSLATIACMESEDGCLAHNGMRTMLPAPGAEMRPRHCMLQTPCTACVFWHPKNP